MNLLRLVGGLLVLIGTLASAATAVLLIVLLLRFPLALLIVVLAAVLFEHVLSQSQKHSSTHSSE
jgi:uncharacterized membrane protein YccC